jgi:hypothetical protein
MPTITDINLEARTLCDATSTDYSDATLLRRINEAYEETLAKIMTYDGYWQFDDSNYTTLPIGKGTLVTGQQDYAFDVSILSVLGVSVKDVNGNYIKLKHIDQSELDVDPEEYEENDGLPHSYDIQGSSILLYPAPLTGSVTMSEGLKVFFQRTADVFTSAQVTTGTKVPGFASPFHYLISYKAAIPYCMAYKPDRVASYTLKVREMEKEMEKFYARRLKDERPIITSKQINFR